MSERYFVATIVQTIICLFLQWFTKLRVVSYIKIVSIEIFLVNSASCKLWFTLKTSSYWRFIIRKLWSCKQLRYVGNISLKICELRVKVEIFSKALQWFKNSVDEYWKKESFMVTHSYSDGLYGNGLYGKELYGNRLSYLLRNQSTVNIFFINHVW